MIEICRQPPEAPADSWGYVFDKKAIRTRTWKPEAEWVKISIDTIGSPTI